MRYFVSLGIAILLSSNAWAMPLAACPPSGNPATDKACQFGLRAKEYELRKWYPEALNKAFTAHLLDYQNMGDIQIIHDMAAALSTFLGTTPFGSADSIFPELNLLSVDDAYNRSVNYGRMRDYAQAALDFSSLLTPINVSDWHTRIPLGDAAINNLTMDQLNNFLSFMEFNILDLQSAVQYLSQIGSIQTPCSVFYPAQFGYSSEEMAYLIEAVTSFSSPACIAEGQRAILVQAFKAGNQGAGDFIVDSNMIAIPYVTTAGYLESLDNPATVLLERIADKKFVKAVSDSIIVHQTALNLTDLTPDQLSQITSSLNALFMQVGATSDQKIAAYEALTTDALSRTNGNLMYFRLAAAYADQTKALTGRRK